MEKTFNGMHCSKENKVSCAAFMLKEGAYDSWLMEKHKHASNTVPYTWEMFKDAFYAKFFPRSEQIQRERDFIKLEQGSKAVGEYEAEFARMSRFAPTLVADEESRARRFEEGLRPQIRQGVAPFELRTYKDVVNKALLVERGINDVRIERETNQKKRQGQEQNRGGNYGSAQGKRHQPNTSNQTSQGVRCPICGNSHEEKDCRWKTGACFKCGKVGHRIADCPNMKGSQVQLIRHAQQGNSSSRAPIVGQYKGNERQQRGIGRAYALTQEDAHASHTVVSGIIPVSSIHAHVLFDSGATHSFVSADFVRKHGLVTEISDIELHVGTPVGHSLLAKNVCKSCVIEICHRRLPVDLTVLEMKDFDVILGIDWLSWYHALVDCHRKHVKFCIPRESEFTFVGREIGFSIRVISAFRAKRLLKKGCSGYLASVKDTSQDEIPLKDIPVVKDFPDVFPDDLSCLPPEREIDFCIELLPGTRPNSKTPYRMAPAELKELKGSYKSC